MGGLQQLNSKPGIEGWVGPCAVCGPGHVWASVSSSVKATSQGLLPPHPESVGEFPSFSPRLTFPPELTCAFVSFAILDWGVLSQGAMRGKGRVGGNEQGLCRGHPFRLRDLILSLKEERSRKVSYWPKVTEFELASWGSCDSPARIDQQHPTVPLHVSYLLCVYSWNTVGVKISPVMATEVSTGDHPSTPGKHPPTSAKGSWMEESTLHFSEDFCCPQPAFY